MTSLSLAVILQMSMMVSGEKSYAEAHQQVLKSGEPMVVMVTADWCPACQVMKTAVLPQVSEHGFLRRVIFATVNVDRDQELGKKLAAGGPIPQLLMYRRTADGWRLRRLIGGHNTATVEEFITQGVQQHERDQQPQPAERSSTPRATTVSQERTAAETPQKGQLR